MKMKASAISAIALLVFAVQATNADDFVGYNYTEVPAQSDVLVCVPFNNDSQAEFEVDSVAGDTLTPTAATGGTYGDGTYYVRFITGDGAGLWSTITADDGTDFTLANADVLGGVAGVAAGDTFRVYKHHTVGSIFTPGLIGESYLPGTSILLYDNTVTGLNRSSVGVLTYVVDEFGTNEWVGENGGDTILTPETRFIVRNESDEILKLYFLGNAPDHPIAALVPDGVESDLMIASGYPVPMTLDDARIGGVNGRSVLTFDNLTSEFNKSADQVITFVVDEFGTNEWVGGDLAGDTVLVQSEAIIVRVSSETASKLQIAPPY